MTIDMEALLRDASEHQFERFEEHVNPVFAKVLRTIGFNRRYVRGEGPHLFDAYGNRYLDFMAGWGVFNCGRNHPTIRKAIQDVVASDFPGWIAFDAPALAGVLAEELIRRIPNELDRVYFCNSGTEAAEAAIKFARAATGRSGVVHLKKAFHGLTTGALAMNGDPSFRAGFEPYPSDCRPVPINDLEALERELAKGDVGALFVETIQGKTVILPDEGYLRQAQELCRRHGTLLVCDEVQTGLGRTGRFAAFEWEGLDPDIVLFSKALSGGFVPVGAMMTRKWIYERVYTSMNRAIAHACTFGMGNLAMAAGIATLRVLDEERLYDNALRMGALFKDGLEAMKPRFEMLHDVRQRGLMIGIEFGPPKSLALRAAWTAIHKMDKNLFPQAIVIPLFDDHRILTQVAGHDIDVVKLLPPLTITEADVTWFLEAFEDVMVKLHSFPGPVWEVLKKLGKHAITARGREKVQQG